VILTSNPKKNYFSYKKELDNAIQSVLNNGKYVLGKNVRLFEKEFSKYIQSKYCVSVASGTDAIILGLLALGIKKGDEIITTNFTANATVTAICSVGAIPKTIDIDENFFHLDENKIKDQINKNTKAIIAVHLYGQSCNIFEIKKIARKYNLKLIEDCSQAHGAEYKNIKLGNFGDLGTFSFYPTKNISAIGDAGAVTTNNKSIYNKLILLREYGWKKRYYSSQFGTNSRLDEIQASILRVKLKKNKNEIKKRVKIATKYNREIINPLIKIPKIRKESTHVFHLFVITINPKLRNRLVNYMKKKNIICLIQYPYTINEQKFFKKIIKKNNFQISSKISRSVMSLPIYPELKIKEQNKVIKLLNEFKN
jgi:dTDP-4-amino-4,6-dideoxygalactose transaminase